MSKQVVVTAECAIEAWNNFRNSQESCTAVLRACINGGKDGQEAIVNLFQHAEKIGGLDEVKRVRATLYQLQRTDEVPEPIVVKKDRKTGKYHASKGVLQEKAPRSNSTVLSKLAKQYARLLKSMDEEQRSETRKAFKRMVDEALAPKPKAQKKAAKAAKKVPAKKAVAKKAVTKKTARARRAKKAA